MNTAPVQQSARRARPRIQRAQQQGQRRRQIRYGEYPSPHSTFKPGRSTVWYLLPDKKTCPPYFSSYIFQMDTKLLPVQKGLQRIWNRTPPFHIGVKSPQFTPDQERQYTEFVQRIEANIRVRWAMKRLLTSWILRKRCKVVNDTDPCTLEAPKICIRLMDWKECRMYKFEANSLLQDIYTRLLFNDELFFEPKEPRNPYTNIPLTYGQLYSIHRQFRTAGVIHWMIEGLASHNYHFGTFLEEFDHTLKREMFRKIFNKEYRQSYLICTQLEFIMDQHEQHFRECDDRLYLWALKHSPDHPLIKQWRKLCHDNWLFYTLYADTEEYTRRMDTLYDQVHPLCDPPLELRSLRKKVATIQARMLGGGQG